MIFGMVNVAIAVIVKEEKVLLIKRERGDFVGLFALPGGKIEECEHVDEAVLREIREELGLNLQFTKVLGVATEIMRDKKATTMLYCCEMKMDNEQNITNPEFQYKWFSKDELSYSNEIVESDKVMIEKFFYERKENYLKLDCDKNQDGKYYWK